MQTPLASVNGLLRAGPELDWTRPASGTMQRRRGSLLLAAAAALLLLLLPVADSHSPAPGPATRLQMVACDGPQALSFHESSSPGTDGMRLAVQGKDCLSIHNSTSPGSCNHAVGTNCSLVLARCDDDKNEAMEWHWKTNVAGPGHLCTVAGNDCLDRAHTTADFTTLHVSLYTTRLSNHAWQLLPKGTSGEVQLVSACTDPPCKNHQCVGAKPPPPLKADGHKTEEQETHLLRPRLPYADHAAGHTAASGPPSGGGACGNDEDCQLNGKCGSDGECKCVPEWTGPFCSQLNLKPARPSPHAGAAERRRALFFPMECFLRLCLSRACLGKLIALHTKAHLNRNAGSAQGMMRQGLRPGGALSSRIRRAVRKTPLFEPFMHKNDPFTKTGSGQT